MSKKDYTFKKPRGFKIEEMLYQDRCMLKWHGMLLSDHNERIVSDELEENKSFQNDYYRYKDIETWNEILKEALIYKKQLNLVYLSDNGELVINEVNPICVNYSKLKCIVLSSNETANIALNTIVHLELK